MPTNTKPRLVSLGRGWLCQLDVTGCGKTIQGAFKDWAAAYYHHHYQRYTKQFRG